MKQSDVTKITEEEQKRIQDALKEEERKRRERELEEMARNEFLNNQMGKPGYKYY